MDYHISSFAIYMLFFHLLFSLVCLLLCQLGFLLLTLGLPPFLSSSCPTNLIWLACTFIFSFISLSILQGSSHVQDVFKSHYNHNLNASMLFSVCLGIQCLGFWSAQQNCQLSEFSTKIPYSPICIYISNLQTIVNPLNFSFPILTSITTHTVKQPS